MKTRLESTFATARSVSADPEVQSHFARYLCVLVSGYLEQAVKELLLDHTRRQSSPSVLRFVEAQIRRQTNMKSQRLIDLVGSFDPTWRADLETYIVDERKDAVDSVVTNRNRIAHGDSVGVTFTRISEYYQQVQLVVDRISILCLPTA